MKSGVVCLYRISAQGGNKTEKELHGGRSVTCLAFIMAF